MRKLVGKDSIILNGGLVDSCVHSHPREAKKRPERDCWLAVTRMAIYNSKMDISVTQFKARCLELIREVEHGGEPVVIKRRGKIVARLTPPRLSEKGLKPWEKLRATGGVLLSEPDESVLRDEDFEAMR